VVAFAAVTENEGNLPFRPPSHHGTMALVKHVLAK
jgi:hypothetical protein